MLQLRVWNDALICLPNDAKFVLVGATRGKEDEKIVEELKHYAKDLRIENTIEFFINQPRSKILELFSQSKVAIHTMKEEHFGISIVEMMSSGLITIAHNSAGPKEDIVGRSVS